MNVLFEQQQQQQQEEHSLMQAAANAAASHVLQDDMMRSFAAGPSGVTSSTLEAPGPPLVMPVVMDSRGLGRASPGSQAIKNTAGRPRRRTSTAPPPSAEEKAATMARATVARAAATSALSNEVGRRRGASRLSKTCHSTVTFSNSVEPLRNVYAEKGEESEGAHHWAVWALEYGAKERNTLVDEYKLTDEQYQDLKVASRRYKQKIAQRKYISAHNASVCDS